MLVTDWTHIQKGASKGAFFKGAFLKDITFGQKP
jgi:hypothetical protein